MSRELISKKQNLRLVVKLTTSCWQNKRGIHQKRSIIILKKLSNGAYDILSEDAGMIGASETFQRITNLEKCKDGVYYCDTTNEKRDWETGYVDEYDFILWPYTNKTK